jgi:hypothetical protein
MPESTGVIESIAEGHKLDPAVMVQEKTPFHKLPLKQKLVRLTRGFIRHKHPFNEAGKSLAVNINKDTKDIEQPELTEEEKHPFEKLPPKQKLERLTRGLARYKHPLSEAGKTFLADAQNILKEGSDEEIQALLEQFPTVENPRLELFADVMQGMTQKQKEDFVFKMTTIQASKGCPKDCRHCVYDPSTRVENMPFITIRKIVDEIIKTKDKFKSDRIQKGEEIIEDMHGDNFDPERIVNHFKRIRAATKEPYRSGPEEEFYQYASDSEGYSRIVDLAMEKITERIPELADVDWKNVDLSKRAGIFKKIIGAFKEEITSQLTQRYEAGLLNKLGRENLFKGADDIPPELTEEIKRVSTGASAEVIAGLEEMQETLPNALVDYEISGQLYKFRYSLDSFGEDTQIDLYDAIFTAIGIDNGSSRLGSVLMAAYKNSYEGEEGERARKKLLEKKDHPFRTGRDAVLPILVSSFELLTGMRNTGNSFKLDGLYIHNHRDNDDFSYRDLTVRHQDGMPAHYGDFYKLMFQIGRVPAVITAGWRETDKVAQAAAVDISQFIDETEQGKSSAAIRLPMELSVNFFQNMGKVDREEYRKSLRNIVKIFGKKLSFRVFGEESKQMLEDVCQEVGIENPFLIDVSVWTGSGRAAQVDDPSIFDNTTRFDNPTKQEYEGYILQPNGEIMFARKESDIQLKETNFPNIYS